MATVPLYATIIECLTEAQSESEVNQKKALQTLVSITKVSPQNRNLLAQTDVAIPALFTLTNSSSQTIQILSLSVLFNLSLNPNLKQALASMENILCLNSIVLSSGTSAETTRRAASLLCSLAMLDKNKAKFGVAGSIQALVKAISAQRGQAAHHLLSSLAELVQFHGNCTLAVRSGAVPVLLQLVKTTDAEDLAGTSLAILCLLARFKEGLIDLSKRSNIVQLMVEVLKGRSMFSKEGAAAILVTLFDASEECLRDAINHPEFSSVVADLSIRGSGRAREKAGLLMRKMMDASTDDAGYADNIGPIMISSF